VSWDDDGTPVVRGLVVEAGSLVTPAAAEAAVADHLDALTEGDWDAAATAMQSGGIDITGMEEGARRSADVEALAALEPELAEQGDLAGLLRAYCEVHGATCRPVAAVLADRADDARTRTVTVELDAEGDPTATFRVSWYEGDLTISGLPPRRA
jgi:hypothetical protein